MFLIPLSICISGLLLCVRQTARAQLTPMTPLLTSLTCWIRFSVEWLWLFSYRRFHRSHAPGPKVTSGLCLYIGLLVAPATNTVKVISNEAGLRLLCCGMCCWTSNCPACSKIEGGFKSQSIEIYWSEQRSALGCLSDQRLTEKQHQGNISQHIYRYVSTCVIFSLAARTVQRSSNIQCKSLSVHIHTFICGDPPQYQNFYKRLCWINMST